ncbi:MAG TPA: hypothetical protein VFF30_08895 [Nitrososphaerales archaeon]|nr:hypothetical protein [Nitrososphaerales archaeon]
MSSAKQNSGGSPPQEEEVKRAADLREWLEGRILEMETELSKLREMLLVVDSVLRKSSFIPATELRNMSKREGAQEQKGALPPTSTQKSPAPMQPGHAVASAVPNELQRVPERAAKSESSTAPQVTPRAAAGEAESTRQLRRSKDGMLIANAFVSPDKVVIVPTSEVKLSQTTPPFQSFFVNRILRGFETKDAELAQAGSLQQSSILRHEVSDVDGHIERITVENYRDKSRLNEILNTLTWAMTRMIEKK